MQVYQTDVSISNNGVINLYSMPYLYNKKVTLVIIPTEDTTTELKQRKLALKRLLKQQAAMPKNHLTDEELDDIRYNRLQAKQI